MALNMVYNGNVRSEGGIPAERENKKVIKEYDRMAEKKETESTAKTTRAKKTTAEKPVAEKAASAKATAAKTAEKAEKTAEKVEETVKKTAEKVSEEKPASKASSAKKPEKPYSTAGAMERRIGAIICWVLAIACEIFAICLYTGKLEITFMNTIVAIVILVIVDLILVIVGSLLWKKANHIDPASKKNKLKFFLWNNMGVIACIVAFIPFLIVILTDKENKDPQMKKICGIAVGIALVIGVLFGIEWSPISSEEKTEQMQEYSNDDVWYTMFGKKYHLYEDCQHINKSDSKTKSTVEGAINHGCNGVCKTCQNNKQKELENQNDKNAVENGDK